MLVDELQIGLVSRVNSRPVRRLNALQASSGVLMEVIDGVEDWIDGRLWRADALLEDSFLHDLTGDELSDADWGVSY